MCIFFREINNERSPSIKKTCAKHHVTTFDSEGDGLVNADDPEPAFCNLMGGSIQSVELDLMENERTLA